MFLRLLIESLRQGRRRKLVAAAAVGIGTLAATAVGALLLASGDRLAAELASYGANLELTPATGDGFAVAGLAKARTIFWRNNLVGVAPLRATRVGWTAADGGELVAPLVGTWFDHPTDGAWRTGLAQTRPSLTVSGRWPAEGAAEVVLGRRLAKLLGVAPGAPARVRLGERVLALTVVGIAGGGGDEEDQAFAPLAALAGLDLAADAVPRAEVLALTVPEKDVAAKDPRAMSSREYDAWYCTAYASSIARQLEEAVPNARATVVRSVAGAGGDLLVRLRGVLLGLAGALLLAAVLGTTAAMAATTVERRLEVGLFGALGAEPLQVATFFLSEAAVLGFVGGLLGGALGLAAGRALGAAVFGVPVPWSPILLPFAVLAGVLVALAGSAPPIWRSVRADAARALRRATA